MSHAIKLFPTVSGRANFTGGNEAWAAESGASINAHSSTLSAQTALRLISSSTLAGAVSPALTLVGSILPVRAEVLYKTADSSQTCNVSVLDQADTVIASTNFAASAFGASYNDFKRATVDVTVPSGTTGVKVRVCQGNDIDGEIYLDQGGINENILLADPDTVNRQITPLRATHATLSGRRVVDVLQRNYSFSLGWGVVDAATYDRLQQFFYRNEALAYNDGDVPNNQEVHPVYAQGLIDHTNIRSVFVHGGAAANFIARTYDDSLLPNDSGWGTDTTSWADAAITDLSTSTGASITTTSDSMYSYAWFQMPTVGPGTGSPSWYGYDNAATMSVDVLTETNSTASGQFGFDAWVKDQVGDVWRRIRSVARTGTVNVVLDFRSTDLVAAVTRDNQTGKSVEVMFRTRATNRGPGAKLTFSNFRWMGNTGFDWQDTEAQTMGTMGGHVVNLTTQPNAISHVVLDGRQADQGLVPTTLTAGTDYIARPDGLALALPGATASVRQINGASLLVHYSRDFLVTLDSIPESWLRTGKTTGHDRRLTAVLSTLRSSSFEELPL